MENITKLLSKFSYDLQYEGLDERTITQTRLFIADYYAAGFAGLITNTEFNRANLTYFIEMGGNKQASILYNKIKLPIENAAFINALYVHGADMDDGNKLSAGHIGASVFSSLFAVGEKLNITWREIILAANVGYELFNRLGGAAQPSLYKKRFHATGIVGGIASGGACAKLLKLDENGIYNAISLAALQSSGLIIIDESGQACKPINPANAARTGVFSAILAQKGIDGPRNPLESMKGWFHTFADNTDEKIIFDGLNEKFTICDSYLKLYPTCRHTHSCIEAALTIRKKLQNYINNWEEIEAINIYIYPNAIQSAGMIRYPKNTQEAKFSIYYTVALALINGKIDLLDLSIKEMDSEIYIIIEKIKLIEDASMEDRKNGIRGCKIEIILANEQLEEIICIPKGEGKNSLSWKDMKEKMEMCTKGILSKEESNKLIERCQNLDLEERFISINQLLLRK